MKYNQTKKLGQQKKIEEKKVEEKKPEEPEKEEKKTFKYLQFQEQVAKKQDQINYRLAVEIKSGLMQHGQRQAVKELSN